MRRRHTFGIMLLTVALWIGAPAARAIEPTTLALCGVAIGVGLEVIGQVIVQGEASVQWHRSSALTDAQKEQVGKAIEHLRASGFTAQAAQLQNLLETGYLTFSERTGDPTLAETYGGSLDTPLNTGFILLLPEFFSAEHDMALRDITPEQRTRLQALTLLHELVHLNEQVNRLGLALPRWFADMERDPFAAHVQAMPALGYTQEEIQQIRDGIRNSRTAAGRAYRRYLPFFEQVLQQMRDAQAAGDGEGGPPPALALPGSTPRTTGGSASGGASGATTLPGFQ